MLFIVGCNPTEKRFSRQIKVCRNHDHHSLRGTSGIDMIILLLINAFLFNFTSTCMLTIMFLPNSSDYSSK